MLVVVLRACLLDCISGLLSFWILDPTRLKSRELGRNILWRSRQILSLLLANFLCFLLLQLLLGGGH